MDYGIAIVTVLAAVLAAAFLVLRRGRASMKDDQAAKVKKIKEIYARARARLETLKRERLKIVSDYSVKLDKIRLAEARKKLDQI